MQPVEPRLIGLGRRPLVLVQVDREHRLLEVPLVLAMLAPHRHLAPLRSEEERQREQHAERGRHRAGGVGVDAIRRHRPPATRPPRRSRTRAPIITSSRSVSRNAAAAGTTKNATTSTGPTASNAATAVTDTTAMRP